MVKPLQINRIDLLVHPFYVVTSFRNRAVPPYNEAQGKKLLKVLKKHIDEVAKDPSRLLLLVETPKRTEWQDKLYEKLNDYIEKKLGKRHGYFRAIKDKLPILDRDFQKFKTFKTFAKKNGFTLDPSKVKTRSLGEYTNICVTNYLVRLNKFIGLKNVIPYRNEQSTIIPRKSVGGYLKPWEIKQFMKTAEGKVELKLKAEKFRDFRWNKANRLAKLEGKGEKFFKPRTHLMKKKRRA